MTKPFYSILDCNKNKKYSSKNSINHNEISLDIIEE